MPQSRMSLFLEKASLQAQSARYQVKIALALITVLPLLSFAVVVMATGWQDHQMAFRVQASVISMALLLGCFGYAILRTYPANIERMLDYLHRIAEGELPDHVHFSDTERDIVAIEGYLNAILASMRSRIDELEGQLELSRRLHTTIQAQSDELIAAERQRVMIESLGAACHHIGQPATVLRMYLTMLKETEDMDAFRGNVDTCLDSIESISDILEQLRRVTEYRTVPYVTHRVAEPSGVRSPGEDIVDISPERL
jgi:signal transduction histidine kinase